MKLPLLTDCFPITKTLAELYGGWSEGRILKRRFIADTLDQQISDLNQFLKDQGFIEFISKKDLENEKSFKFKGFTVYKNVLGTNELLFVYDQPIMRSTLEEILSFLNTFRIERNWNQFHTSKNLAMAISAEAGEILDLFLWDREKETDPENIEKELADIVTYCIYLADNWKIDLLDAVVKKLLKTKLNIRLIKQKEQPKNMTSYEFK